MINFLKQAFWTSLNSNISSFISFLSIAILARFISPDTFGIYIFCLASKEIITSICAPSLSQTYLFSNGTLKDFKNVCKINLIYSILIIIFSILGAIIIKKFYGALYFNIIILFGFLSILNNYSSIFLAIREKKMDFKKASFFRSISLISSLVLTCLLAFIFGDNLIVLVIKEIIFSILLLLLSITFYFDFKKENLETKPNKVMFLFNYSLRSYFPRLTETLSYKVFDLITASILGKNLLGIFNQTLNIVKIPYRFLGSITDNILFVHLKSETEGKKIDDFILIQSLIIILIIPFIFIFNLFNYEIINIVLGSKWLESAKIIGLLSIFLIILPFYNSLITIYQASDNQRYYTITNCLVLFIQIIGIFIFSFQSIDKFILTYCLSFYIGSLFLTFKININNGFNKEKLNVILIIITCIFALLLIYNFYQFIVSLLVLFFLWIYLIIKNKNFFIKFLKHGKINNSV